MSNTAAHEYLDSYLLLILKLIRLNLLNLLIYSESINNQTENVIHPRQTLGCYNTRAHTHTRRHTQAKKQQIKK